VGYGEITKEAVPISEFVVEDVGKKILELPLEAPQAADNSDSPQLSEWAVGVKWLKALSREEAKTFKGIFANQNIVCKLRDPKTIEFVHAEFAAHPGPPKALHPTAAGAILSGRG
jgi:hypothetical protein